MPRLDVAEVLLRGSGLRHAFCECSECEEEIVGPRFRCIHCADFNLCVNCDRKTDLSSHPDDHVFEIVFKPEYDLTSFLPAETIVEIADQSSQQGWEAVVTAKLCEDVYSVRLKADKSIRAVHRSGLHIKLLTSSEVAQHIVSQVEEEDRIKQAAAAEAHRLQLEKAQALKSMKEDVCAVQ